MGGLAERLAVEGRKQQQEQTGVFAPDQPQTPQLPLAQQFAEQAKEEHGMFRNLVFGVARGVADAGIALVGTPGLFIPGDDVFEKAEAGLETTINKALPLEDSRAFKAGRFGGRMVGEGAQVIAGGAAILRGVTRVLPAAGKAIMTWRASGLMGRALADLSTFAPVDLVIGGARGKKEGRDPVLSAVEEAAFGAVGGVGIELLGKFARRLLRHSDPVPRLGSEALRQAAQDGEDIVTDLARNVPTDGGEKEILNAATLLPPEKVQLEVATKQQFSNETQRVAAKSPELLQKRVTHESLRKAAKDIGMPELFEGTVQEGLSNAQLVAARNMIVANTDAIASIGQRLKNTTMGELENVALARELDGLFQQNDYLIGQVVKARTEAGRRLNLFRQIASVPEEMNIDIWLARAWSLAGDKGLTDGMQDAIIRLVKERDWPELHRMLESLKVATPWDKIVSLIKAGWLSAPTTHIINTTSTSTSMLLETVKDAPGSLFDMIMGKATGLRTTVNPFTADQVRAFRRGIAGASRVPGGGLGGGVRGAREVLPKMLGGHAGPLETMKLDVGRRATNWRRFDDPTFFEGLRTGNVRAMGNAFADAYVHGVFRVLSAEDQFFKGPIIQRSLVAQARARAIRAGERGAGITRRAAKLLENPTDEMWLQAFQHADEATFQNRTALGNLASAGVRAFQPLELVIPFQRTPGAIATRILEMSPLGFVTGSAKMARVIFGRNSTGARELAKLQREAAETLGRSVTGFGFVGLGWILAEHGLAVGRGPDYGTAERVAFDLAGMQENSILMGGEWWNWNRLAPGGSLVALGATLRQLYGDGDRTSMEGIASAPLQVGLSAIGGVLDLPFLQGLNELQRIARNPDERFPEFVGELAAATIPFSGALGNVARTVDPIVREKTEGNVFTAAVMSRIPALSQGLPHKTNALGEELVRKPGKWHTLLNPLAPREFDKRPWVRELVRLGGGIPRIERADTETLEQYQYRLRQFGEILEPVMERAIATPFYQQGVEQSATMFGVKPDLWRKAVLEELIKMVRSNVAMVQRPELVRQRWQEESREQILSDPFNIPIP